MESVTQSRSTRPPRRRAAVACLSCRKRKVRCDVARCGMPCSNCRLDDEECSVTSKRGHLRHISDTLYMGQSPALDINAPSDEHDLGTLPDFLEDIKESSETSLQPGLDLQQDALSPTNAFQPTPCKGLAHDALAIEHHRLVELETLLHQQFEAEQSTPQPVPTIAPQPRSKDNHVLYTFHPFLRNNDFSTLEARDFALLEAEGCFRIPNRQALNDFMQKYFVFIHPLLPMMDETQFWKIYEGSGEGDTIPLVLIQAMLFATTHCVSPNTINSLGFSSAKKARAEYYRRAKLLYDMSPQITATHALAQAALLLCYWSPPWRQPTGLTPNTLWLVHAVQYAYSHHAHLYQKWDGTETDPSNLRLWKRIWWCCIIRDRIISLGLRRAPQITRNNFDFENSEPLCWRDLYAEGEKPRFFSNEATCKLQGLLQKLLSLCVLMTDFQQFSQCFHTPVPMEDQSLIYLDEVRSMKASLQSWHDEAGQVFVDMPPLNTSMVGTTNLEPSAMYLHTHILQMYYYSAVVALAHYELLLVLMAFPAEDIVYSILRFTYTPKLLQEVKDASNHFAQCLDQLVKPGLAKLLPITMTAYVIMPLIQHLVDLDVGSGLGDTVVGQKRERLGSMVEALRTLSSNFDGVDWVNNVLKESLQKNDISPALASSCAAGSKHQASPSDKEQSKNLDDSVIAYLRVAFTAEVSLSSSKLAGGTDIPVCLASLFRPKGSSPDRSVKSQGSSPQDFASAAYLQKASVSLQTEWEEFHVPEYESKFVQEL